MTIYRLSREKLEAWQRVRIRRTPYVLAVMGAVYATVLQLGPLSDVPPVAVWGLTAFGVVVSWVTLRRQKVMERIGEALPVYEWLVDKSEVILQHTNGGEIRRIARRDIRRILDYGQGFYLCTDSPRRKLWVSSYIEDYEQFKTEMLQGGAIPVVTKSRVSLWLWMLAAYLAIGIPVAILVLGHSLFWSWAAWSYFWAIGVMVTFQEFSNPFLARRTFSERVRGSASLWALLVFFFCLWYFLK